MSIECLLLNNMNLVESLIEEVMMEKGMIVNEEYDEGKNMLKMLCDKGE